MKIRSHVPLSDEGWLDTEYDPGDVEFIVLPFGEAEPRRFSSGDYVFFVTMEPWHPDQLKQMELFDTEDEST